MEERNESKLEPMFDRILVRRAEEVSETPGGIIIPDEGREVPKRGTVVSVGIGRLLETGTVLDPQLEVGDEVLFGKYSGIEVEVDGEELLILKEDDVLGRWLKGK